jgi:dinuclear metal center YbgI/SA1388 family protein
MGSVGRLIEVMEAIAPARLAEAWDNVGLIVGDPAHDLLGPVLLTIDLNEEVAHEALGRGAGAVVAYHPPIFEPLRRLTAAPGDPGRVILPLVAHGVAVHSPHTALDAAPGGVNDWLLEAVAGGADALASRRALSPHDDLDPTQTHKIVVFIPRSSVAPVRDAMASAGAGVIGDYERCSYMLEGRGTFFGSDATNPAVGERGRLEEVEEVRLEMVCGRGSLARAIEALRGAHPYEEPAFDVHRLEPRPDPTTGPGRVGTLRAPAEARTLAARLRDTLGVPGVRVASCGDGTSDRVAVCPGAGGSLADAAVAAGAGIFVTGEMRHHDVLAALDLGLSVVLAGHTNTERGYLPVLAERLSALEPALEPIVSEHDRWPFEVV